MGGQEEEGAALVVVVEVVAEGLSMRTTPRSRRCWTVWRRRVSICLVCVCVVCVFEVWNLMDGGFLFLNWVVVTGGDMGRTCSVHANKTLRTQTLFHMDCTIDGHRHASSPGM